MQLYTLIMMIKEIVCKTALSKSSLPGLVYSLNPYRGCVHNCIYCYAPDVIKETRPWGTFVDVKKNIVSILEKNLLSKKYNNKKTIGISTVTDPYQDIEKKYEITRNCLLTLQKYDIPISIQTKSDLVLRDIVILKKFSRKDVGITITTINDEIRKKYENFSSSVADRLKTLKKICENDISTWVFIGPIIPFVNTEKNIHELIENIYLTGVRHIIVDKLRLKKTNIYNIKQFLSEYFSVNIKNSVELQKLCEIHFFNAKKEIFKLCKKYNIRYEEAFSDIG